MSKQEKTQVKVAISIEDLWKGIKDLYVIPKIMPNLVKEVELLEGDGSLGSVFLFKFAHDVPKISYQKEKIVELDDSLHHLGIQVIEGGHLNYGFSSYATSFKLTAVTETETLVDAEVSYETEAEDSKMPGETTKSLLFYFKCLEDHLSSNA